MAVPNDEIVNAIVINQSVTSQSTVGATVSDGEDLEVEISPYPVGATVWFSYLAPVSEQIEFNTYGSSFDTTLQIYQLTNPSDPVSYSNLMEVGANEDTGVSGSDMFSSVVSFDGIAGKTYYIQVGGSSADEGDLVLNHSSLSGGSTEQYNPEEMYRLFNTKTGEHFFTVSKAERDQVIATNKDYKLEGSTFYGIAADQAGATEEVYRLFNTKTGDHFFTASEAERDQVIAINKDYKLEGIAFYAFADDQGGATEEVYRLFNTKTGDHFFTASEAERDQVIAINKDYKLEGIAFYAPDDGATFVL